MSTQFSRSIRSLNIDGFRASIVGMILAGLILVALIIWFLVAKVTLYETSSDVQLTADGIIIATFQPEAMSHIRTGQAAVLRVKGGVEQKTMAVPALVINHDAKTNQAEILVMTGTIPQELYQEGIAGSVEVEVEHITPANLVMRASGNFFGSTELPLSPQSFENQNE